MTMLGMRGVCLLLLALTVFLGCEASEGPATVGVSGTVTQKGVPVADAVVSFIASDSEGQTAVGTSDSSGIYSLTTRTNGDGAIPGQYKVTITKFDGPKDSGPGAAAATPEGDMPASYTGEAAAAAPPKNMLPAKYASPDSSGFSAAVSAGAPNTHNFDLKD